MRASKITILVVLVISLLAATINCDDGTYKEHRHFKERERKKHYFYNYNKRGLKVDFYRESCPQVEKIVQDITWSNVESNPTMAAKLLRLHYHDCFVRVCICILNLYIHVLYMCVCDLFTVY